MYNIWPNNFPLEIIDKILLFCDTEDILELGEENVSEYVWLRKKDSELSKACEDENIIGVAYILKYKKINWFENYYDNDDAIYACVKRNNIEIIKLLLSYNIDHYDCTSLHLSMMEHKFDITKLLLNSREYDLDEYEFLLSGDVVPGYPDVLKVFIENGIDIIDLLRNNSAENIHDLRYNGHLEFVNDLIKKGISIYDEDNYKLLSSISKNDLDEVRYLVEKCNVDIHKYNNYALRMSASYGYLKIVKYLIKKGRNSDGVLRQSALDGCLRSVKFLVKRQINLDESYDALLMSINNHRLEIARFLIENVKGMHIFNPALELSARRGYFEIVEIIINSKDPRDVQSTYDWILKISEDNYYDKAVKYLQVHKDVICANAI
jgi:ankyrin repeat protein